jgi:hypothetical protein
VVKGLSLTSDADRGESEAPSLPDPLALLLEELLNISLIGGLAPGQLSHLAVECVLPHAPEEGSVVAVPEVGLELEVRGELLEPRRLYLELAQIVRGHLVEDLQGDLVSVHDVDSDGSDEVELLAAPEEVVEDDDVDVPSPGELLDLLHFAAADVELGEGAVAALDHVSDYLDAQGLH